MSKSDTYANLQTSLNRARDLLTAQTSSLAFPEQGTRQAVKSSERLELDFSISFTTIAILHPTSPRPSDRAIKSALHSLAICLGVIFNNEQSNFSNHHLPTRHRHQPPTSTRGREHEVLLFLQHLRLDLLCCAGYAKSSYAQDVYRVQTYEFGISQYSSAGRAEWVGRSTTSSRRHGQI